MHRRSRNIWSNWLVGIALLLATSAGWLVTVRHFEAREKAHQNATELEKRGIWMATQDAIQKTQTLQIEILTKQMKALVAERTRDRLYRSTVEQWIADHNEQHPHNPWPPLPRDDEGQE